MLPLESLTWSWPDTPIAIAIVLLGSLVVHWLLNHGIKIVVEHTIRRSEARRRGETSRAERLLARAAGLTSERHRQRAATIGSLLRSLSAFVIASIAIMTVMSVVGIPLAPLLTSAGVGGIALAFGAQSLVKDFLSGFFMIAEDQYGVGDWIDTGTVQGTVEEVGLRITRIRDGNGMVWYIRNGEITRIGNVSQGWSTSTIDIPVAYDEDPEKVMDVLRRVVEQIDASPEWKEQLLESPSVLGIDSIKGGQLTFQISIKSPPNQQWGVAREIRERAQQELTRAGVKGPAPQQ